jgi:hypothetical protein
VSADQAQTPEENKETLKLLTVQCEGLQSSMTDVEALSTRLEAELIFENEHCRITVEQVGGRANPICT